MRGILIITVLVIISLQYAESRVNKNKIERLSDFTNLAVKPDTLGISDIWSNIKNSAQKAWNSVKNIIQNTKDKIQQWTENVREKAHNVANKLEERIKSIREKSKSFIEQLVGTGKLVKECFKKENEAVEELLKQIINFVSTCVSDNLMTLRHLDNHGQRLLFNETNYVTEVENKMNKCLDQKDVEECLHNVRQDIYTAMETIEDDVMATRAEARGIADNLLDTVINCSVGGLLNASNIIAVETIQIITCVSKG